MQSSQNIFNSLKCTHINELQEQRVFKSGSYIEVQGHQKKFIDFTNLERAKQL